MRLVVGLKKEENERGGGTIKASICIHHVYKAHQSEKKYNLNLFYHFFICNILNLVTGLQSVYTMDKEYTLNIHVYGLGKYL